MRLLIATVLAVLAVSSPASAEPRVEVGNESGNAAVDPTYLTDLTLRGRGFQSIQGGHGGIYVFFGTVRAGWRPSQGGQTGVDYFYVPDAENAANQGYSRFVAFPGSDTAGSANGGTIKADGSWSTTIRVPGAVFEAYDREGGSRAIDCRRVTCGIVTVGAHGVTNARNESFTPVRVENVSAAGEKPSAPAQEVTQEAPTPETATPPATDQTPADNGPAVATTLTVDRGAARAGHVLSFSASGLPAGAQVTSVLDDGIAGAGPFLVGDDGRLAGVITLPADLEAGTHELRLFGVDGAPSVSFGVSAAEAATEAPTTTPAAAEDPSDRAAQLFVAGATLLLLLAVGRLVLARRRGRHG